MSNIDPHEESAKVSRDWPVFTERLTTVLSSMQEDQFLTISDKNSQRYIQFAAQGAFGMRAEISSNAYLPRPDRLSDGQMAQLAEAGWRPPTGSPSASTPEKDPDGSPNFFIDHDAPIDAALIVEQAVRTLVRILRIPHPGFLTYDASDCEGNALVFPELGLKHTPSDDENDRRKIARRLLAIVREIIGINALDYDEDGDIGISFGGTATFLRLVGNPPYVRLYAPLLQEVRESPELLARLNKLNANTGHMRFFVSDETIFTVADVPAAPLDYAHLTTALGRFCEIANGMDKLLDAEFGGKTIASEHPKRSSIH